MKAILAAATLALTTPALAGMPVSSGYGDVTGCALFGTSVPMRVPQPAEEELIVYVSPERVLGLEWGCLPTENRGDNVTFACEADEGSYFTQSVTIRENVDGTLTYGNRTLNRCPVVVPPSLSGPYPL